MAEQWDDKFDYLNATRGLYHNQDYWRFLVRDVWRLDTRPSRLIDFGCGFGWVGLFLMPMLAEGSEYTGLDLAAPLLEKARALFDKLPYRANFIGSDANRAPFNDGEFDVAFAHTLLMHLPEPRKALAEMIRVTRDGGLVIVCEANRNATNAALHVHESDEQDQTPLSALQAMNAHIRRQSGIDYNIGMKMPVLMHQAGLRDVQARVSDAIRVSFPPIDTPEKERLLKAICDDGLGGYPVDEESFAKTAAWLTSRGMRKEDAENELRREMKNDYRRTARDYHIVQPGLITISFGIVNRKK